LCTYNFGDFTAAAWALQILVWIPVPLVPAGVAKDHLPTARGVEMAVAGAKYRRHVGSTALPMRLLEYGEGGES
jgi:hypothetical protein